MRGILEPAFLVNRFLVFPPFFSSSKITECGRLRVLQFHLEFLTCQCKMLSEKNSSQVVERIPNVVSSIDIINVHSEHCIVFISFLCNFEAESRAPNAWALVGKQLVSLLHFFFPSLILKIVSLAFQTIVTDSKQPSVQGNYVSARNISFLFSFCLRTLGSMPPPAASDELHSHSKTSFLSVEPPFLLFFLFFFFFFLPQFHLYIPLFISTLPFLLSASPIHPLYHQPHLISIPELFYLNLSLHSFQSFCFFLLSFLVENLLRSLFLFFLLLWCICVR